MALANGQQLAERRFFSLARKKIAEKAAKNLQASYF
jgi:hypothetical protein